MSVCSSNCTIGILWSRGMGYESAKRREVNSLEIWCLRSLVGLHESVELGMKWCIEELH